jgi:hypothetical protein
MQDREHGLHNQLLQELTPPPKHLTRPHDEHASEQDLSDIDSVTALSMPLENRPAADRAQVKASLEGIRGIQKALSSLDPAAAAAGVNST